MAVGLPGNVYSLPEEVSLSDIDGLILDIDGVLVEGDRILPGAVELISRLNRDGTPYVFYSNNTTYPFQYHVDKLLQLGVPYPSQVLLTAARVTAQVLAAEAQPGTICFVLGELGLIEALREVGFVVTQDDYRKADYVVIGMDRQLTYEKLKNAALAIRAGARFISSNPDPSYPDGVNIVPASGAIQAALEASTGVPARVTGKPASPGFKMALNMLGTPPHRTGMLGDQPQIDICGAAGLGLHTFLILSSLTPTYEPGSASCEPDATFGSAQHFLECWEARSAPEEFSNRP